MNELTAEWVEKAEGDYATAGRELRARKHPNYDATCFHAQQAAEKYLKGFLQQQEIVFPRVHNLIQLLELCLVVDPSFEFQRNLLIRLDRYSISFRYPGESADKEEARRAFETVRTVRQVMRAKLGLLADRQ